MSGRKQIVGDTVDAGPIKAQSKEQNRSNLPDGSFKQTLSSVRAKPTVLISEDDWKYNQDFPSIGVCVIINNKNFLELDTRHGTEKDEEAAKRTFKELGYKVIVYNDLTKDQMEQKLREVSNWDHSETASFVCVILSHGKEDAIYATDRPLTLEDLTFYFKGHERKTLIGKPKLFFLQACRGIHLDGGRPSAKDMVDAAVIPAPQKIPVEADFLYAYATAPGYFAWRNGKKGSWFIQSLCDILLKHKDLELMHIMTRVNRRVAFEHQSTNKDPKYDGKMEIPCITSMLTKEFYFTQKIKK